MVGADDADSNGLDEALGELWRRNAPATEGLGAEVRMRGRLMALVVAVEVVLAGAAGAAGVWAISLGTAYSLLVGAFALAFAAFAVAVSWGAHRGEAWAAAGLSVRDQLDNGIAQAQAMRRWTRAGYAVALGAVIFLAVALFGAGRGGPFPWVFAVGGLAYIGAAVCVCAWLSARHARRLERLEALRRQLFDDLATPG